MKLHAEALFITQAIILIGLPYTIWRINRIKKYMPLVVIQIIAGILLGPSVMGIINPGAFELLFPKESLSVISGLGWIAIIFFVFMTGMHLDFNELKGKGKSFMITSLSSILVPFIFAGTIGWWIAEHYPIFLGQNATNLTFALSLGIAAGVTALPVLSAILIDMDVIHRPIGKTVLGYATVNDGTLWILVSILLALISSGSTSMSGVARIIVMASIYIAIIALFVRPLMARLLKQGLMTEEPDNGQMVWLSCSLLLSALVTELLGLHYILGAFVFGTIIPKEMTKAIHRKLDVVVSVVLLPFFFMITGLKTLFDASATEVWMLFAIMTVVSSSGKILGTALPAKKFACSWKEALTFGGFMQCKGLMEVVVLNMMLQAQIISPIAFSAMIFMAIATTAITKPSILIIEKIFQRKSLKQEVSSGIV